MGVAWESWIGVAGSAALTIGAAWQALLELSSFKNFHRNVMKTRTEIIDEEVRALIGRQRIWRGRDRRALWSAAKIDGDDLLTAEEKATNRNIDYRILAWLVVFVGSAATTTANTISAVSR